MFQVELKVHTLLSGFGLKQHRIQQEAGGLNKLAKKLAAHGAFG
jgi:hypothetical protein